MHRAPLRVPLMLLAVVAVGCRSRTAEVSQRVAVASSSAVLSAQPSAPASSVAPSDRDPGECEPVLYRGASSRLHLLRLASNALYWAEASRVLVLENPGGAQPGVARVVSEGAGTVHGLAVDATHVYVTVDEGLFRVARAGNAERQWLARRASPIGSFEQLGLTSTHAVYSRTFGVLARVALAGGPEEVLATGADRRNVFQPFAVSERAVYYVRAGRELNAARLDLGTHAVAPLPSPGRREFLSDGTVVLEALETRPEGALLNVNTGRVFDLYDDSAPTTPRVLWRGLLQTHLALAPERVFFRRLERGDAGPPQPTWWSVSRGGGAATQVFHCETSMPSQYGTGDAVSDGRAIYAAVARLGVGARILRISLAP